VPTVVRAKNLMGGVVMMDKRGEPTNKRRDWIIRFLAGGALSIAAGVVALLGGIWELTCSSPPRSLRAAGLWGCWSLPVVWPWAFSAMGSGFSCTMRDLNPA
jgi:hypothetical protein